MLQLPLECFERCFGSFGMHFNVTVCKIAHVTVHSQPFGGFEREVTVPDALHAAANKVVFRAQHTVYDASANFALFQAVMPPTTFEMFRKPNCSSRLVAIDER